MLPPAWRAPALSDAPPLVRGLRAPAVYREQLDTPREPCDHQAVRGFFGLGVLAAGIVASVTTPRVLQFASWEHAPDLWLSAHDLRLAALIAASCGLLLVLSAFTLRDPFWSQFDEHWLAVGASLLAAGTLPLLVIRTAENDAGIDVFVPSAYVIVLRAVQVLLVVTAIGAALAAAGLGRRGTVLGIGVGVVFAVLTAAGALNKGLVLLLPLFGGLPVLAGVPAATALLLIWSGHRARLGAVQYAAAAMVLVGMPVLYGFAILVGLPLGAMTWNRQDHRDFDGFPYIGAGPAAAFALLILHLFVMLPADPAHPHDDHERAEPLGDPPL